MQRLWDAVLSVVHVELDSSTWRLSHFFYFSRPLETEVYRAFLKRGQEIAQKTNSSLYRWRCKGSCYCKAAARQASLCLFVSIQRDATRRNSLFVVRLAENSVLRFLHSKLICIFLGWTTPWFWRTSLSLLSRLSYVY